MATHSGGGQQGQRSQRNGAQRTRANAQGPQRNARTDAATRPRRRLYPAIAGALFVVLLLGFLRTFNNSGETPEGNEYQEQGFAEAPAQFLPPLAESTAPEENGAPRATELTDEPGVELTSRQVSGAVPLADLADPEWVLSTAQTHAIPQRAVRAYAGAALRVAESDPSCQLGWNTLAGIGRVESVHGSFGGSGIAEDGTVTPPIIGIALDGSAGVMAIEDTDNGELDGDSEWDRAVGPMQFIPTTWNTYAVNASASGEADPQNIDDAALTAARYLCSQGENISSYSGWVNAVTSYNQSVSYVNEVGEYAQQYVTDGDDATVD